MLEVVLETPGSFVAREPRDVDKPRDGEALVRVLRIGVCGTDLHAFKGRQPFFSYPRILGHELAVEVLEAPAGSGLRTGDLCAVEPYVNCERCGACRKGKANCCETLEVLGVHRDGGMRDLFAVPARLLHSNAALSADQLALVETLGIGAHAVLRSGIGPGETALIVGAGPIGLAAMQFVQAAGAHAVVRELSEARREFVERLGARTEPGPTGQRYDYVFDATGNARAMEAAFESVAFGGKLILIGIVTDRISFEDPLFHRREMTLLASRNSTRDFPRIMGMIASGQIDTRPWITDRMGLAEVPRLFPELYGRAGLVKAMIEV